MYKTLITADRLREIVRLCKESPKGFKAEVGVYQGGSLKYLSEQVTDGFFFGFDTFTGLPAEQWNNQEVHNPGDFADTDIVSVAEHINNPKVLLIPGLFPVSAKYFEDYMFSFVHIDTDFYESVKTCIQWFSKRMLPGGTIVFDDFQWPSCPGVEQALKESGLKYKPTEANFQAYIRF